MIILLSLMTIFGLGRCLDQLPTEHEIQSSINRTINEVERLIKVNPSLPRLSRRQIVDILYNITSQEVDSLEESVEKARSDYQRALMVVLPYNSRDAKNEDIKDLFTKPPMVQMIPDTETMLPFASIQAEHSGSPSDKFKDNLINVKYASETNDELGSLEDESESEEIYLSDGESHTKPEKFSFVLDKFDDKEKSIIKPTINKPIKNEDNKNNSTIDVKPGLRIIYNSVVTEKPTTKIMKTTLNLNDVTKPTVPSTMSTNTLTFDQWKYFAPPATLSTPTTKKPVVKTTTKQSTSTIKSAKPLGIFNKSQTLIPTTFSTKYDDDTPLLTPPPFKKLTETSFEKSQFEDYDMEDYEMMNDEPLGTIYVTPMPSEPSPEQDSAALSTSNTFVSVNSSGRQQEVNKNQESVNIKHQETLFESLGINSKKNKLFIEPEKINLTNTYKEFISSNSQVLEKNNNLANQLSKLTATGFDNSPINLKGGLSNLTPDVRSLFQRFGLQALDKNKDTEKQVLTTTKNPVRSIVRNSWSGFKPLPRSQIRDEGMKSFLAQFGLGVDNRKEKSIKSDDSFKRQSILEFGPGGMKSILENIGLIVRPRENKKIDSRIDRIQNLNGNQSNGKKVIDDSKTNINNNHYHNNHNYNNSNNNNNNNNINNSNISNNNNSQSFKLDQVESNHVFKPHEAQISDQKQKDKINKLLDTVKLVQEGKAQVTDVRRLANDLLEATKTLKGGPDPISLEELMRIYHNDLKNEVKRQSKDDVSDSKKNGSLESSVTLTSTSTSETPMDDISSTINTSTVVNQESNLNPIDADAVGSDTNTDTKPDILVTIGTESTLTTEDPNLKDLADSFGGSTAEPDPILPTPKKNGLYFLLDWNSFLEVGEEGKDRVNLRLAPKVGDRTKFIPVVIP